MSRVRRDIGSTFVANAIGAGAAFVGGIVLARWLGPGLRGLFELGLFVANSALLVLSLGVNLPVSVFGTQEPARGIWAYRFGLWWLMGLLAVGGLVLATTQLEQAIALGTLAAFAALFFNQQVNALLVGVGRIGWLNLGVAARWFTYLCGLLGLWLWAPADAQVGLGWFAASALVGTSVAAWGIGVGRGMGEEGRVDRSARLASEATGNRWNTLWFGMRGQLSNIFQFASYRFDVVLVSLWVGKQGLGVYAVGVMFAEALWLLPNALGTVLLSHTPRSTRAEADRRLAALLPTALAVVGVGAAGMSVAAPFAVRWYLGAGYREVPVVTWCLMPGAVALSGAKVLANELTARGFPGINAIIAAVGAVVTVACDVLLIPKFGIVGAAVASSIGYTLILVMMWRAFRQRFPRVRAA